MCRETKMKNGTSSWAGLFNRNTIKTKHARYFLTLCLINLFALLLFASDGPASPALGAHAVAFFPCNSTGGLSTPAIATQNSGSTILAWVGRGNTNGFIAAPLDNKTNTYALVGMHDYSPLYPGSGEALYTVSAAAGGSGHVVSAPMPGGGDEISLAVVEVKNGGIIQDVQWNKVLAPPHTSLHVTTTGPATLVAIWAGDSGAASVTATPNNNFTNIDSQLLSGCDVEVVVATKNVTNAGTYNVTWTATPSQGAHMWLAAVQSAPPILQAQVSSGNIVVNWPGSATNYGLETSSDLSTSNSWKPVTNIPTIVNSQNTITNAIFQSEQYYRLKKQ